MCNHGTEVPVRVTVPAAERPTSERDSVEWILERVARLCDEAIEHGAQTERLVGRIRAQVLQPNGIGAPAERDAAP